MQDRYYHDLYVIYSVDIISLNKYGRPGKRPPGEGFKKPTGWPVSFRLRLDYETERVVFQYPPVREGGK